MTGTGRKHRGRKAAIIFSCVALFVAGLIVFRLKIYGVAPVFSEMTCEYGEALSEDVSDYISGMRWSVRLGELDLSQVDETRTGTYQAYVSHGGTKYTYTINIRDTVPPRILWKSDQVYAAVGAPCAVEDIIEGVEDADPAAEAFFVQGEELLSEIIFDRVGEYELWIVAKDTAGNETEGRVSVIADTAPVIEGIRNFYMVPGSEPDYLEAVTARDDVDGDLTEYVQADDSEVRTDREGIYPLYYVAEDSFGLETVEEARVMVAAAEDIQELIGHRKIDYRSDVILGAPNIYDAGVSEYEDMEATLEYVRPAFVQLYHPKEGGYTSGSGYIMEITEDAVYICTNCHVVEKYGEWEIYFFDGTKADGKVLGSSDVYDVGVVTVDPEELPEELLERLMTVHIDKTYWESLSTQGIELGLERVDREGGLIHTTVGNLIRIKQNFVWNHRRYHTEVTVELVHGDSGSALVDGYGNLICMAYGFSMQPTRYWCVPLDGILECYEEITGRVPYVY